MMMKKAFFATLAATVLALLPCTANAQTYATNSLLASGSWYKIPVDKTGVYKITSSDISALAGVSCSKITLYGAPGGMLNPYNGADHPDDLVPAAIQIVDRNSNGTFDADDYILFYGESAGVWRYVSVDQRFEYTPHVYANHNYYFLSTDLTAGSAARVRSAGLTSSNRGDLNTYTGVAMMHDDKANPSEGGQIWVGDKFTTSLRERSYTLTLPGIQQGGAILARYAFSCQTDSRAQFELKYNSDARQHAFTSSDSYQSFLETFTARNNREITLNCTFSANSSNTVGYIDFIEFNSTAPLAYSGGQMMIRNAQNLGTGNVCRFVCTGSSANLMVWDVTRPDQPSALSVNAGSGNGFSFLASTAEAGTYVAFTANDAMKPTGITSVANQDLHGTPTPDYVIVAHKDYLPQAERLANLHRATDGLSVLVVNQTEVFNEFSSGRPDPVAIRQMLRCMNSHATDSSAAAVRYLLLFGKGTYDNRNILGANQTTVVTYQTLTSAGIEDGAFPSDDIYGYLDDAASTFGGPLSVGIGRLPAKTVTEATHMVDKIEDYITKGDLGRSNIRGDWRNYVCFLADDADPSSPGDTSFASSAEKTARNIKQTHPHFNIDRIFADAYVQQSGADGSYYPDVNNAVRQRLNYGCLLFNYIGHGSVNYIGTERYMQFSDIEKYSNSHRLTFFVTSTCSFGRYDQLSEICGAEALLLAPAAGIGVVTASRPISHIHRFNDNLCMMSLDTANTVGDALRMAKNATSVSHSILLLGDPAMRLSIPRNRVVVTKINGHAVNPATPDSAEVLSRVTVEGEIHNEAGLLDTDFNGELFPIVFDREVSGRTLANDNDSTEINFRQQKNVLYKGHESVSGGRFSYSFIVPRDVAYRYDYAKLSHYARSESDDATGQYGNLMLGGYNEDTVIGEIHPHVELYINDTRFRNGGLTNETPTLYAILTDSVGINAAGSGLGHDITAVIDNNPFSTTTLNDFFEADIADSRNGRVRYTLGKLDEGMHTLTVKCWNIFNYSGSATIQFYVVNDRIPKISSVGAAPNPSHDRTTLRVEHNIPGNIESATIDIYDIMGSHIRTFHPTPAEGSYVIYVDWDYTSAAGSLISRGIYIVRATVTTRDGEQLTQMSKIVRD